MCISSASTVPGSCLCSIHVHMHGDLIVSRLFLVHTSRADVSIELELSNQTACSVSPCLCLPAGPINKNPCFNLSWSSCCSKPPSNADAVGFRLGYPTTPVPVGMPWDCHEGPQSRALMVTEIYCLPVLEARESKSKV